jgi:acyl-coenzyme A thioesterase PaaI-like protein
MPEGERLADLLRRVIDHLVAADVPREEIADAVAELERVDETFAKHPRALARSVQFPDLDDLQKLFAGDPVIGRRNPIAPPLEVEVHEGAIVARGRYGRTYEGPPGFVHGAMIAAAFDQILGLANIVSGNPGMTGTLTVKYKKPTPLHTDVVYEARTEKVEGRKIFTKGTLHADGVLTAEAQGIFVNLGLRRAAELFSGAPPRTD